MKCGTMKYRTLIFSLVLLVATWAWSISSALATSYYVYEQWGGTYYDANKSFTSEDSQMCWAASASDILAWTGWGKSYSTSADSIFAYFQQYWTNAGGSAYVGWDWWFDGTNLAQGGYYASKGWSQVDTGGGGFYTGYNFLNYFDFDYKADDAAAMDTIEDYFSRGDGVSLSIATSGGGAHAITCWGYKYDENGNIVSVYVTDSDDRLTGLIEYRVLLKNGEWYLEEFYGTSDSWYIAEVLGLKNVSAVPEPATMLLLGLGLMGLAGIRRKFSD